ncbi:hypothetical protein GRI97_10165 [Altererythrobacter xixiisoli]|uniref:Lipoprotein n=1 Tax=Croceibacterium xixiisoli TaxID=1476466 RepID=A0A6I4TTX4_9SPHN|nr:hypothetical protein [Croceibacterium xixiisoli]MXO99354.1 hypothetical protein [Croceibacterium xixiisoli]
MKTIWPGALVLALAACSQADAPSDKIEAVATSMVEEATGAAPVVAEPGPYAPRNDCQQVKGADLFLQQLSAAVKARDAEVVATLAAEDVKLDFGGGSGRAELRSRLATTDAPLWGVLDELLTLGCASNRQSGITLPWYFEQEIPGDPFNTMIVTGEAIPLLPNADGTGTPTAQLSWEAVTLVNGLSPEAALQQVKHGKDTGYIATDKLRSIVDYRLFASSRNGTWRITSFVAGD